MNDDLMAIRRKAQALRAEQRYTEADALLTEGIARFPEDFVLRFFHAQTRYELGHPAAALFGHAEALDPGNPEARRNRALALVSEGAVEEAERFLRGGIAADPGWLDGLKALATLKWTQGEHTHFADHYGPACRAEPSNANLWMAWFGVMAQTRNWACAGTILDEAQHHVGETPAILASRLFIAVEAGDEAAARPLMAKTAHIRGNVISLCRIRHALRQGNPALAEAEALPLVATSFAPLYWPYLSLAWRMQGDDRWLWLDRPDELIATLDSGLSQAELDKLAEVLRGLHTAQAPYIEQSVRGGTQTDRSVLLRHEKPLRKLKARMLDLIADYVAALPPPDPRHPLLSAPRARPFLVAGSWSVKLARQGYNVPHTHAMGWLSTAFYVSLPPPEKMGADTAGNIAFGGPPAELGLDLEPYRTIRPQAGQLTVFPSTTWHGTVPFDEGERLVVAFDIGRPR